MAITQALQDILDFIQSNFNITLDDDRIAGFEEELSSGTGRSMEELRADLLKFVVTEDRLKEYIKEQFESRGLTADDDRVVRIVGEFLTEGRQFNEFTSTLDDFSTVQEFEDNEDVTGPEGASDGFGGIMSGGTIHKITNQFGQSVYYIVEYEFPPGSGHSFYYRFKDAETLEQAVGPNLGGGDITIGDPMDEGLLRGWAGGGAVQLG